MKEAKFYLFITRPQETIVLTEKEAAYTSYWPQLGQQLVQVSEEDYYRILFHQKYPGVEQPDSVDDE